MKPKQKLMDELDMYGSIPTAEENKFPLLIEVLCDIRDLLKELVENGQRPKNR